MALHSPDPFVQPMVPRGPAEHRLGDPLWEASRRAEIDTFEPDRALRLWDDLVSGQCRPYAERIDAARSYALLRSVHRSSAIRTPLSEAEATVLRRVLGGEQQKVISSELGIAHSTASKRLALALDKLELRARAVPLPIVIAAQSASEAIAGECLRIARFTYEGCDFVVASVARPKARDGGSLTLSERSIAELLIEGRSRWEIAGARTTSVQTVSCQLRSIFAKFQSNGRYGLTRRAVQRGWFAGR